MVALFFFLERERDYVSCLLSQIARKSRALFPGLASTFHTLINHSQITLSSAHALRRPCTQVGQLRLRMPGPIGEADPK